MAPAPSALAVEPLITRRPPDGATLADGSLLPLDPIETWSGVLLGAAGAEDPTNEPPLTPPAALERVLLPALARTPCLVAFSGGRDSSALLATAAHVARQHGLPDPIPATYRYAKQPRTEESEWQEAVVDHVGLDEWLTIEVDTEFDVLGDLATAVLRRHGLYWPPNAHTMVPLLNAARGGTLITGNGGDEVLSPWVGREIDQVLRGRRLPSRSELKWVAMALSPHALRAFAWRRRPLFTLSWLTPSAQAELLRCNAQRWAHRTGSWAEQIDGVGRLRYIRVARAAFRTLAADAGCALVEPFFDPLLTRAIGRFAPSAGYASRTEAFAALFGELLPAQTIARSSKAAFTEVLCGPAMTDFVTSWDGRGIDDRYVEPEVIRQVWAQPRPDFRSLTALQAAWLSQSA